MAHPDRKETSRSRVKVAANGYSIRLESKGLTEQLLKLRTCTSVLKEVVIVE